MQTWRDRHPGWEYRLHTSTVGFRHQAQLDWLLRTRPHGDHLAYSAASDIMRFELLATVGGVYVDVDTECVRTLPERFMNAEAFACWENDAADWIASCVLGARAGASLFQDICDAVPACDMTKHPAFELGPGIVTRFANQHPELDVHPARTFCPQNHNGVMALGAAPIYSLHHWGGSGGLRHDAEGRWIGHGAVAQSREATREGSAPLVSVVIPCYQQAQYLAEAVASVRAQSFTDWEIIVAAGDGASYSAATTLAYAVVRDGGKGLGHARNVAIAPARGRYILPLDADDVLEPTFLAKTIAAIDGCKYGIAGSYVSVFGDRGGVWPCAPWGDLRAHNALPSCALFTKSLWEAVGGYDVTFGYEDWDFWLRCSELSPRVVQLPECLFKYRVHAESLMTEIQRENLDEFYQAMLRLRHPSLYPAERRDADRLLVAHMPVSLHERLEARCRAHPQSHPVRALSEMARSALPAARPAARPIEAPSPARRPDMRSLWQAGLAEELGFWEEIMKTGGLQWPDDFRAKISPDTPLHDTFRTLLASAGSTVRILDVGAGPFTSVGKRWDGHEVLITAIDPLADEYARLLRKYGRVAPVPTIAGHGESLTERFPADTFDLVHARNSLDHTYDPLAVLRSMLAVTKLGGHVWLSHAKREADAQGHTGLHQWNLYPEAGCFWVEGGGEHVNVSEELSPLATIEVQDADSWFTVTMQKRRHGT